MVSNPRRSARSLQLAARPADHWDAVLRLPCLRSDSGFSLVETLVASLTVALLAAGVFAGIDGASQASGIAKARAVAGALAQEDQERLRSISIAELANRDTRTTRRVDGVPYTVRSMATYVQDSVGTTACGGSAKSDYVSIVSEVSWPARERGGSVAPVRLESLVAPPTGSFSPSQGSVAVQVRDRAGALVPGVTLELSGSQGYRQTTNELGCGMFAYIEPGTYTLTGAAPGMVDRDGHERVDSSVSVSAGTTRVVALEMDQAATVTVRFETTRPGETEPEPTDAEAISIAHPSLSAPGYRVFPEGGPQPPEDPEPQESFTVADLFPFSSPYGVYSGNCPANDPALYNGTKATVTATPGGHAEVIVNEPALDLRVSSGLTPLADARVVITGLTPGCNGRWVRSLLPNGRLDDVGLPYGVYTVCVSAAGRRLIVGSVDLTGGGVAVDLPNISTGVVGSC